VGTTVIVFESVTVAGDETPIVAVSVSVKIAVTVTMEGLARVKEEETAALVSELKVEAEEEMLMPILELAE
jgi:hypothetical protein